MGFITLSCATSLTSYMTLQHPLFLDVRIKFILEDRYYIHPRALNGSSRCHNSVHFVHIFFTLTKLLHIFLFEMCSV